MKNFISLIHNESDKITNVVAVDAISTIIDINDSETGLFLYSKIKLMGGNTFMVNQNCQQILELKKAFLINSIPLSI